MFTFANKPCFDPRAAAVACAESGVPLGDWYGVANSCICQLGAARPDQFLGLMLANDLGNLNLESQGDVVVADVVGQQVRLKTFIITRLDAATPGAAVRTQAGKLTVDAQTLYVVEAQDRRWLRKRICGTVQASYNVRAQTSSKYDPATINGATAWTWEDIASKLWAKVFPNVQLDAYPKLPFAPDGTPENFCYYDWNAAQALDDFLARLACAVKRDPIADSFSIVRLGMDPKNAQPATPDPEQIIQQYVPKTEYDPYPILSNTMQFPATVRVQFLRMPVANDCGTIDVDVAVPLQPNNINAGSFVVLQDDLAALLDSTGANTNVAALNTRATERMNDWYRKRKFSDRPALRTFIGVFDLTKALGANYGRLAYEDRGAGPITSIASDLSGVLESWRRSCACSPSCVGSDTVVTNVCLNPDAFVLPGDIISGGTL